MPTRAHPREQHLQRLNAPNPGRFSHWRAGCLESGHVRFGGRPRGEGQLKLAPRRAADPTRHLVKGRLDTTGARWGLDGAEAVLELRALRSNGDFDTYWA